MYHAPSYSTSPHTSRPLIHHALPISRPLEWGGGTVVLARRMSGPAAATSMRATSMWPLDAAQCNGVPLHWCERVSCYVHRCSGRICVHPLDYQHYEKGSCRVTHRCVSFIQQLLLSGFNQHTCDGNIVLERRPVQRGSTPLTSLSCQKPISQAV
jgi:hypothetical protein